MEKLYFIYLLTNKRNTVIYTGMTNNLKRRIYEHKQKIIKGFTKKYNVHKLVYYEVYKSPQRAIEREKQIKAGSRQNKINLIEDNNPEWKDLYDNI